MEDWKKLYKKEEDSFEDYSIARYSKAVMDHFSNPRNVGYIENPDGKGTFGSTECGDYLEVYIMCDGAEERITEIKWQAYGCAGLISTTSALTELVQGATFAEALEFTDDDIISYLGGIPEKKRHCSMLCLRALEDAILNYRAKQEPKIKPFKKRELQR
jgi:NifU-like protein involved in Fe-S cluster formation